MEFIDIYTSDKYQEVVPSWHAEDSPWKAKQLREMIERHHLTPQSVCEVGSGAGGVLAQLQEYLDPSCTFDGYEVSPEALQRSKCKENEKLHYQQKDFSKEGDAHYDLMLIVDVVEHVEDYFSFLRNLRSKADYKLIHLPLELSVLSLLRPNTLLKVRSTYDIHYFTKELALAIVKDAGYDIIDYQYTPRAIAIANTFNKKLMVGPRKLTYWLNKDLAARVLGGFSILVLAR